MQARQQASANHDDVPRPIVPAAALVGDIVGLLLVAVLLEMESAKSLIVVITMSHCSLGEMVASPST